MLSPKAFRGIRRRRAAKDVAKGRQYPLSRKLVKVGLGTKGRAKVKTEATLPLPFGATKAKRKETVLTKADGCPHHPAE